MKKEEPKKELKETNIDLQSFVLARDEASKKLQSLRDGLRDLEAKREKIQASLTLSIRKVQDEIGEGKNPKLDESAALKNQLSVIDETIGALKGSTIPQAETELQAARLILTEKVKGLLAIEKEQRKVKVSAMFQEIEKSLTEWRAFVEKTLTEMGSRDLVPYYEKEQFFSLILRSDYDRLVESAHQY